MLHRRRGARVIRALGVLLALAIMLRDGDQSNPGLIMSLTTTTYRTPRNKTRTLIIVNKKKKTKKIESQRHKD